MENVTPPPIPTAPSSAPATAETTGLPRHLAAAIAVFFPVLGGVAFLTLEKKDPFVRFYAMQSIFLGAVLLIGSLAFSLVELIFRQIPIIGGIIAFSFVLVNFVFSVAWLIVWLVTLFKAFTKAEWEVPVLGKMARRRLVTSPA